MDHRAGYPPAGGGEKVTLRIAAQIAERLATHVEHGIGYSIHDLPERAYDPSVVDFSEREVIPALA